MCHGVKKFVSHVDSNIRDMTFLQCYLKLSIFFCVRCRRTRVSESEQKQFKICPHVSKNGVFVGCIEERYNISNLKIG